ncbi:MAG: hypothetical protein V3V20_01160 [Algisphaera sp.]
MDLDQTAQCAACGYDLMGVGWEGYCPECGSLYDKHKSLGIRRGEEDRNAIGHGTQIKIAIWGALALACWAGSGLVALGSPSPMSPLLAGGTLGAAFAFVAYAVYFIAKR